jgi:Mg-chelatase subunit ChlD
MIIFEPASPWSYIALSAIAISVLLIIVLGIIDYVKKRALWQDLGGNKLTRFTVLVLTLISAILLAMAAMNPFWTDEPGNVGYHLQVAVDVSESVMRAQGGWDNVRGLASEKIKRAVEETPSHLRNRCTASILTFRDNTNEAWQRDELESLPEAFSKLEHSTFASGSGTNIEAGLKEAASLLEKAGSQGAIVLISDGNQTDGNALAVAQDLSRQGVPVHVLPVTSRSPAVAITDANLPPLTHSKTETFVRGLMLNRLKEDRLANMRLTKTAINSNEESIKKINENKIDNERVENKEVAGKEVSLPTGKWVRFRWPVVFESFGLQFIDLSLAPSGSTDPHHRRFYTYVKRPPRILAIGGDNRWISAIRGDVAQIIPVSPTVAISKQDLKEFDAVVINEVPAQNLRTETMSALIDAVESDGKGFLLVNGGHYDNAYKDTETVLMSYKDTPLDHLLPVHGGPRPFRPDPPSRQVAIIIDTSGSMGGWRMAKSKQIAKHIILNLLRPKDRLDLITFTTGAGHLIIDKYMTAEAKKDAIDMLNQIKAGGGTDPRRALALIGNRMMKDCGIIFISDGEFGLVKYRPDCKVTAFEIGSNRFSRSKALKEFAEPIPVFSDFDPNNIKISFFDPKKREKFWEKETFTPLSMSRHLPKHIRLPIPEIELNGSAVSYLKEGGILIGVRPKLTDPVLAFAQRGDGYVGVFTAELAGNWIAKEAGKKAIEAWLGRLVPFMERDRYIFHLEDFGDSIEISISLAIKEGKLPDVTGMTALIKFPDGEFSGVALRQDESTPGTFHGEIRVERKAEARPAFLSLKESGLEAVPRAQRIPIIIPPRGHMNASPSAEAYTYGQNRQLLRQISEVSGGMFNPAKGMAYFKEKPVTDEGQPLWPILAVIAAFCYLSAIAMKRWNP